MEQVILRVDVFSSEHVFFQAITVLNILVQRNESCFWNSLNSLLLSLNAAMECKRVPRKCSKFKKTDICVKALGFDSKVDRHSFFVLSLLELAFFACEEKPNKKATSFHCGNERRRTPRKVRVSLPRFLNFERNENGLPFSEKRTVLRPR